MMLYACTRIQVLGGGSGGIASARHAAKFDVKVFK
jgi:hypothetical protein